MRLFINLFLAALITAAPLAHSEEFRAEGKALSGDEIELSDGRILRLTGIKAATPEAKTYLNSLIAGKSIKLNAEQEDRYGRLLGTAEVNGISLEEQELSEGMAYVYPGSSDADYDKLFEAEEIARKADRGFWKTTEYTTASNAKPLLGKYGFVEGIVTNAIRIKNKVYLSIGEKPDFTIVIAAKFLRPLKKVGIDALNLNGTPVRVRGMVVETPGPGIVLADLNQLHLAN